MSLYVIGDLHLSLGDKSKDMSVFGGRWIDYVKKIENSFSELNESDVCVLAGDTSWGMSLEASLPDFEFLQSLPGKKILLKGNHDLWWETASKMNRFFQTHSLDKFALLHNNCIEYDENTAICGTRGWFYEEETGGEHDERIMNREIGRYECSLKAAGDREKLAFLHYPPLFQNYICRKLVDLNRKYEVKECYYGHIHAKGCYAAFRGTYEETHYSLISADYLNFIPFKIR